MSKFVFAIDKQSAVNRFNSKYIEPLIYNEPILNAMDLHDYFSVGDRIECWEFLDNKEVSLYGVYTLELQIVQIPSSSNASNT